MSDTQAPSNALLLQEFYKYCSTLNISRIDGCERAMLGAFAKWLDNRPTHEPGLGWLDEQPFYEIMQAYRHAHVVDQAFVVERFEKVKEFIRERFTESCPMCSAPPPEVAMVDVDGTALYSAPPPDPVREAALALVRKLKQIEDHPDYQSIWVLAGNRGMPYRGPNYSGELQSLKEALGCYGPTPTKPGGHP